jgi:hypothetical protein
MIDKNPIQFYFPKLGGSAAHNGNLLEALRPDPAVFQDRLLADRANLIVPASRKITLTKPQLAPAGGPPFLSPPPRRRYPFGPTP